MSLKSAVFVRRFTLIQIQINVESMYLSLPVTEGIYWVKNQLSIRNYFFATSIVFLVHPVPDAINIFLICLGRLLNDSGSLLKTEPSTWLEYALRPPTSPINSGFSLKERNHSASTHIIRIL